MHHICESKGMGSIMKINGVHLKTRKSVLEVEIKNLGEEKTKLGEATNKKYQEYLLVKGKMREMQTQIVYRKAMVAAFNIVLGVKQKKEVDVFELAEELEANITTEKQGKLVVKTRKKYTRKDSKKNTAWTEEEDKLLKEKFKTRSPKALAKELGRTVPAIHCRANHLGLFKYGTSKPWSWEDDKILKEKYNACDLEELAKELNRTSGAISVRACLKGLKKKTKKEAK